MSKLERDIEEFVSGLGFELVTLDRGGGHRSPTLTLKIDRRHGEPGRSEVTVGDCTRVARDLRAWLEENEDAPEDWVLEVSSPGVERPLVRPRDYRRFAGRRVELKGYGPLVDGAKRVEGTLLGLADEDGEAAALEVDGERVEVPLASVASAKLTYDWEDDL
ncbi:MAG: ribosome maturation factor RimP [Gemmatimonadota bacterium]